MTMENATIVQNLQNLFDEWTRQFENKPQMDLHFGLTPGNQLSVNGIPICPVSEVDPENATYDAELLFIPTVTGSSYEIYLDIPYNGPGKIGHIHRITPVYCAE